MKSATQTVRPKTQEPSSGQLQARGRSGKGASPHGPSSPREEPLPCVTLVPHHTASWSPHTASQQQIQSALPSKSLSSRPPSQATSSPTWATAEPPPGPPAAPPAPILQQQREFSKIKFTPVPLLLSAFQYLAPCAPRKKSQFLTLTERSAPHTPPHSLTAPHTHLTPQDLCTCYSFRQNNSFQELYMAAPSHRSMTMPPSCQAFSACPSS